MHECSSFKTRVRFRDTPEGQLAVAILLLAILFYTTWRVVFPEDFRCPDKDCAITHPGET